MGITESDIHQCNLHSILSFHKIPFSIFLDLSKAFDTLDHTILLDKLKYYGNDKTAHRLFESYLKDRKQYVDIDGTSSEIKPIITGVSEGSILGPLLFIIYINDISFVSNLFKFIIYADETTLETTIEIATNKSSSSSSSLSSPSSPSPYPSLLLFCHGHGLYLDIPACMPGILYIFTFRVHIM